MRRTRLSLLFVAASLLITGAALALAPRWTIDLLGADGAPAGDVGPRVLGVAHLALGALVAEVLRQRAGELILGVAVAMAVAAAGYLLVFAASGQAPLLFLGLLAGTGSGLAFAALRARRPGPFARLGRQRDSMEMR